LCVRSIDISSVYDFDIWFRIVPTVWYFFLSFIFNSFKTLSYLNLPDLCHTLTSFMDPSLPPWRLSLFCFKIFYIRIPLMSSLLLNNFDRWHSTIFVRTKQLGVSIFPLSMILIFDLELFRQCGIFFYLLYLIHSKNYLTWISQISAILWVEFVIQNLS
jgi:hypothetical protein